MPGGLRVRIACAKRAKKRPENIESWKSKGDRRRAASAECSVNLCHAVGNGCMSEPSRLSVESLVLRYYEIFVRLARPHKHNMEFDATRTACFRCRCGCRFHHTIKSFSVHESSHTIIAWLSQQSNRKKFFIDTVFRVVVCCFHFILGIVATQMLHLSAFPAPNINWTNYLLVFIFIGASPFLTTICSRIECTNKP